MKCNVGKTDRMIRVVLGLIISAVGIAYQSGWAAVGLLPILTAAVGFCPAHLPLGISTCKSDGP